MIEKVNSLPLNITYVLQKQKYNEKEVVVKSKSLKPFLMT